MSEVVHYKGKLTEIKARRSISLQDIAKNIIDERGVEWSDYDLEYHKDDHIFVLCDTLRDEYVFVNERLYKFTRVQLDLDEDIYVAELNDDGSIDYEVKYYNGGGGFEDAIENALDNSYIL